MVLKPPKTELAEQDINVILWNTVMAETCSGILAGSNISVLSVILKVCIVNVVHHSLKYLNVECSKEYIYIYVCVNKMDYTALLKKRTCCYITVIYYI